MGNYFDDIVGSPFSMVINCPVCGAYTDDIVAYVPYPKKDGSTGFIRVCEDCGDKYKNEEIINIIAEKEKHNS